MLPEDPILLELVPEFIASWRHQIATLLPQLASTRNHEELYRFGHTLKGSARQFGFSDLADCGAELMDIARHQQWDHIGETIRHIEHILASLEDAAHQRGLGTTGKSSTMEQRQ
ncbi:MAG: Hpt domain-containing protein [Bacteroidota bacterium]|nr:Hpt domain-containing protein [Bacteroidota bacterium]